MRLLSNFPYDRVLVLGLARSGTAVAKLLLASNISVRVNDQSKEITEDITQLKNKGAEVILGSHPTTVLDGIQLLIKNPGIPYSHPLIQLAEERNIPIITDIELIRYVFPGSITAITGSNGKTTTTRLIEHMLKEEGQLHTVAGNIGTPVCEVAPVIPEDSKLILELSSFQLLGIKTFKPNIAVLLNVYEAHLDYHKTLKHYEEAKYNIFKNQGTTDFIVYNIDDPKIVEAVKKAKAKGVPFSTKQYISEGASQKEGYIYFKGKKIIGRKDIVLAGDHHLENILAAISVAKLYNVSKEAIVQTLKTFEGVKHRLQFVDEIKGRRFYNDSKATNILATEKALQSFRQPTILLAGGLDRGNSFDALIPSLTNVKHLVVFGENAQKLIEVAEQCKIPFSKVENVAEAAEAAYKQSEEGDIILLSPASASWDQYKSFEQRGDMFVNAVHKLK